MVARAQKRLAQPPRAGAGVSGADGVPRGAPGLARRKNRVWFASKSIAACACCARAEAVFLHNSVGTLHLLAQCGLQERAASMPMLRLPRCVLRWPQTIACQHAFVQPSQRFAAVSLFSVGAVSGAVGGIAGAVLAQFAKLRHFGAEAAFTAPVPAPPAGAA